MRTAAAILSLVVSLLLAAAVAFSWWSVDRNHVPAAEQLPNQLAVERMLEGQSPKKLIPTGLFIQSLEFADANDVQVTGYVWQTIRAGEHDGLEPGVTFPEAVGSQVMRESYRHQYGDETLIGWYFEATLRQEFDYLDYPLDHKTVWIRLWDHDANVGVQLVPDLQAYDSTGLQDSFGLDERIVLRGWKTDETYFAYRFLDYDTNFGIRDWNDRQTPELYFNVVLRRQFLTTFVVHLVPLFVIAIFAWGLLLTVSADATTCQRHGFNTIAVISACSALIFVVMIAHTNLRRELAGAPIVFLEKIYLLMYLVILGVAVNAYLNSASWFTRRSPRWLANNHVPQLLFWPFTMGVILLLTLEQF